MMRTLLRSHCCGRRYARNVWLGLVSRELPLNYWSKHSNCDQLGVEPLSRAISHSTLIVGRIHAKTRVRARDSVLERYLGELLEREFAFTPLQASHVTLTCLAALETHLNSRSALERVVSLVSAHFVAEDVYFNPQVFLIHWKTLFNRIHILTELGFNDLRVAQIDSSFRELLRATPNQLRESGVYCADANPLKRLLSESDCPHAIRIDIEREVEEGVGAEGQRREMSFEQIRRVAIARYLAWRLECDYEKALNMFDKRHSRLNCLCFSNIALNVHLLLTRFQVPLERLRGSTFLLCVDSNNLLNILRNISTISGKSLVQLGSKYPILLNTKYSTLCNNLELLKRYAFTEEQISKGILALSLSCEELEKRILLLKKTEDLKPFMDSARVISIIVHMNSVFERLERLKGIGCVWMTLDHLIGSKTYFETLMLQFDGQRANKNAIESYLQKFLSVDYSVVRAHIGQHPYGSRLNVNNANRVVAFLIGLGHAKQQIVNGIFLVLYEYELVKQQYKRMIHAPELQPFDAQWRDDPFVLQLLIYYIEKSYSFTGNGVYMSGANNNCEPPHAPPQVSSHLN